MVFIVSFKAVDNLLSMKWKPGWIPQTFKSSVKDVKALIISVSLLFFIAVVRMSLESYPYMTYIYLSPLIEVVGKRPHRSEKILLSLVLLGSTVVQYTTFVLILSSSSVSGGFSFVDYNPCLLTCRCPIVVFLDFSRWFLIRFSVRPGQVFRKPCLIALRRLDVVGMKSAACKYWASSDCEVCARMLFTTFFDFFGPRGTSHIPVFLFLVPLVINSSLFWMDITCLSSVMVHP